MKKQAIKLANVRKEFKVNKGTFNRCLTEIYAVIKDAKENGKDVANLRKVMPKSKREASAFVADFHKANPMVGQYKTKYKKDESGNIIGGKALVIPATTDMVLRYFVAKYNEAVPEAAANK